MNRRRMPLPPSSSGAGEALLPTTSTTLPGMSSSTSSGMASMMAPPPDTNNGSALGSNMSMSSRRASPNAVAASTSALMSSKLISSPMRLVKIFAVLLLLGIVMKRFHGKYVPEAYEDIQPDVVTKLLSPERFCPARWERADPKTRLAMPEGAYFIAINLHDSEDVLPHLLLQLLQVITLIGRDSVFVSIYESGSIDMSRSWLANFDTLLTERGVPHIIQSSDLQRSRHQHRIDFLSTVRNLVLQPLYQGDFKADRVIFINDVFFCAEDVVRLAQRVEFGDNVDMACGLDYIANPKSKMLFYDVWVTRDMDGQLLSNFYPFFSRKKDQERLKSGQAIPIYNCWNGLIVLKAEPFYKDVRFRSAGTGECVASECALFCKDLWNVGPGNMLIDPAVMIFYDKYAASRMIQYPLAGVGDVTVPIETSFPELESKPAFYHCLPLLGLDSDRLVESEMSEATDFYPILFDPCKRSPDYASLATLSPTS